jgi:hypothetical protein
MTRLDVHQHLWTDRPVVEPAKPETGGVLDWETIAVGLREAFGRDYLDTGR